MCLRKSSNFKLLLRRSTLYPASVEARRQLLGDTLLLERVDCIGLHHRKTLHCLLWRHVALGNLNPQGLYKLSKEIDVSNEFGILRAKNKGVYALAAD
jgi:hypothetical protein